MSELNDIVAVGLDLTPKTLVHAYSQGVFPWPTPGLPLLWYCPQVRGVLDFKDLHVGRRLNQYLKKSPWTYTVNRDFSAVIDACSQRGEDGTWITDEMKAAYLELHQLGHAHSVEVWEEATLIGGLYGVDVANTFAGESMFHWKDNASKAALLFACGLLRRVGRSFIDIQVITPHMEALGAKEISRGDFLERLKKIQKQMKVTGPSKPFAETRTLTYFDWSSYGCFSRPTEY